MSNTSAPFDIAILGAGIAGLASALALTKFLSPTPTITVFEIRPTPSTIGGAVNLTPNALRYLHHLGVLDVIRTKGLGADVNTIELFEIYSGGRIGVVDFSGPNGTGFGDPPYKALRIMRSDLLSCLLSAVSQHPNIDVQYDKLVTSIVESPTSIALKFADSPSTPLSFSLLLGCDGIHSAVRTLLVEPARSTLYTGIAVAYSFSPTPEPSSTPLPWKATGLASSRRGSFMTSFFTSSRSRIYTGAVMEVPSLPSDSSSSGLSSRQGWKAKGADQAAIRADISSRFNNSAIPSIDVLLSTADDWTLYPVYTLPPAGRWSSPHSRAMLLGDAGHAMAPQGESSGLALEDAILFARVLALHSGGASTDATSDVCLSGAVVHYTRLRRPRIDAAYAEAQMRWETVKDSGWLVFKLKTWLTPWFLWWSDAGRRRGFAEDLATMELRLE